jgi:hypothetical protein
VWSENDCNQIPSFRPLCCSSCSGVVRGTHFCCRSGCVGTSDNKNQHVDKRKDTGETIDTNPSSSKPADQPYILCETCARNNIHPLSHLRKFPKHCVITNSVSLLQSQQICQCHQSPSSQLSKSSLFPFRYGQREIHYSGCGLLNLTPEHFKVRYADIHRGKNRWNPLTIRNGNPALASTPSPSSGRPLEQKTLPGNQNLLGSTPSDSHSPDPKPFLKSMLKPIIHPVLEKIPFGNVHMALMFGPLVIENGVPE